MEDPNATARMQLELELKKLEDANAAAKLAHELELKKLQDANATATMAHQLEVKRIDLEKSRAGLSGMAAIVVPVAVVLISAISTYVTQSFQTEAQVSIQKQQLEFQQAQFSQQKVKDDLDRGYKAADLLMTGNSKLDTETRIQILDATIPGFARGTPSLPMRLPKKEDNQRPPQTSPQRQPGTK